MACVCKFVANANNEIFAGFSHRDLSARWISSYMQLAFKSSTPKHIQKYYDVLVSNDIKGPMLWHDVIDDIEIEETSKYLSPEQRMRNYDQKDICIKVDNLMDGYRTTFDEPPGCSKNLEKLFSNAIEDTNFPLEVKYDARSTLKGMFDDAYRMADNIGIEGVKKFESVLNEFKSWCNQKRSKKMIQTIVE